MRITGRLAVDEAGCVYSATYGGVGILWPDDYSVRVGSDGTAEVVDSNGEVILREGDGFHAAGGFGEGPLPCDCTSRHPEFVVIESAVGRLEPT